MKCDICGIELEEPGALLFSPPTSKGKVDKYHICSGCYTSGFCLTDRNKLVPDMPWEG